MSSRTFQLLTQKVTGMARMGMARDKYWTSHNKLCQTWLYGFTFYVYCDDLKKEGNVVLSLTNCVWGWTGGRWWSGWWSSSTRWSSSWPLSLPMSTQVYSTAKICEHKRTNISFALYSVQLRFFLSVENGRTKYIHICLKVQPSLSPRRNPPPNQRGGGTHSPADEGVGESQFRRLKKSLALCLLCDWPDGLKFILF